VNLGEFLTAARMYWKAFAAATLAVLAAGLAWLLLSPLQYVSTAQLLVSLNGTTTANAYQNDDVVAGRVNSYVALITSDVVSQRVVDKLKLGISPQQLAAKVSAVHVPPNTAVIDIAVTDPSAEQARRIADTVAEEFVAYTHALESPTGEDAQKVQTTIVSAASQPRSRLIEKVGIGGLIGVLAVLAGAVAVWIRSATDPVVRTAQQAARAAGLPVLAVADSGVAESLEDLEPYRRLRAALNRPAGSVTVITAADGDPDVAPIAANLSRAIALAGERSVVVDAETEWSTNSSPAGIAATVPTSLARLRQSDQHILIAAGPVLGDPLASVLAEQADAVVLVVTLGQSRSVNVRRVATSLDGLDVSAAGALAVR
jgi:capsular polysaccharide biosynthesis protein